MKLASKEKEKYLLMRQRSGGSQFEASPGKKHDTLSGK
jgi:hypothetical protein